LLRTFDMSSPVRRRCALRRLGLQGEPAANATRKVAPGGRCYRRQPSRDMTIAPQGK
jgi:hypothetical protein